MAKISLVCLAAGMSKRFGGELKQLARVGKNNETLIECIINQAIPAKFDKIIFVVREETKEKFEEIFGKNYKSIPVFYALQKFDKEKREKPWGTGDAVCSAIEFIQEPCVVCTGDDLPGEETFKILTTHLRNKKENATAAKRLIEMLPKEGTVNRGIFRVEKEKVIDGEEVIGISRENFKERGFGEEDFVSISIFALHPQTINLINERLNDFKEKNRENKIIEFYLNIHLIDLIKENKIEMNIYSTEEEWIGITNKEDEERVKNELNKNIKTK